MSVCFHDNFGIIIMVLTSKVIATQKRLGAKYKASQQASEDWYRRAQLALEKGEESLAREALKRRKTFAVGDLVFLYRHLHFRVCM